MTTPIAPDELAERLARLLPTSLFGFDVDGVLAPLVDHADDSRLTDGVWDALDRLAGRATIAVVSGRSLESLERLFAFPEAVHVLGSHGLERRGADPVRLAEHEQETFEQLEFLGQKTVEAIGDGAWLEYKVASVAVHARQADLGRATEAFGVLQRLASMVDGAAVKPGSNVVELLARHGNKGHAFAALGAELGKQPGFFIGDDVTDEDAFEQLGPGAFSVRVGPGPTGARFRLADAAAAAEFVIALAG